MLIYSFSSVTKLSVLKNCWSYHSPDVKKASQPAGDHLDPHGGRVAGVAGQVPARGIPVGESHHHVEGGKAKHYVEQGPTVGNLN